jgi:hypothetical protein
LHAPFVDRLLPGDELFRRQTVLRKRVLQREETAANGGDDLGLAADNPPVGIRRRQIAQRQGRASRSDHVLFAFVIQASLLQHGLLPHHQSPLMRQ